MKPTKFAKYLTEFFTLYLSGQKNVSKNTIYSYRDTFKLLLNFCQQEKNIAIEKINIETLTAKLIKEFLAWLESKRKCSAITRNQRLASIHSFFRYIQSEEPSGLYHYQQIISIPMKKSEGKLVNHLSPEAIKLILNQPDTTIKKGRRDLTLLSVLYDTGARVQEIIDLKVEDMILDTPPIIVLTGKGNKMRRVPLMKNTVVLLQTYLKEHDLNNQWKKQYPVFINNQQNKLTKEGVAYILKKYAKKAREDSLEVPEHISPHMLRHSKAMHLLRAGVNLIYIRDFLGHAEIKTTEVYAKADTETKRLAIENAYPDLISSNLPDWNKDGELISWLSALK